MTRVLTAHEVVTEQDRLTHTRSLNVPTPGQEVAAPDATGEDALWFWVRANHAFNAALWAEEDLARRTHVPDAEIVANKRAIDRFNQSRNDAAERIDETLLATLQRLREARAVTMAPDARLNSESAGSIIDRLSILSLKIHAMRAHADRHDLPTEQQHRNRERLALLQQQRQDLMGCLDALLQDAQRGTGTFKVYRALKMYNDPQYQNQGSNGACA